MCFSIEKLRRLELMAAEMIHYYVLNLLYIFTFSSWYYCSCKKFQGCELPNGEENYCYICRFKLNYYPAEIEKILILTGTKHTCYLKDILF